MQLSRKDRQILQHMAEYCGQVEEALEASTDEKLRKKMYAEYGI